jgi:hypothetical protein
MRPVFMHAAERGHRRQLCVYRIEQHDHVPGSGLVPQRADRDRSKREREPSRREHGDRRGPRESLVGGASGRRSSHETGSWAASGGQSGIGISLGSSGPREHPVKQLRGRSFFDRNRMCPVRARSRSTTDTLLNCDNGFTSEGCTAGISNAVLPDGRATRIPLLPAGTAVAFDFRRRRAPARAGIRRWRWPGRSCPTPRSGALYSLGLAVAVRDGFTVGPKATLHIPARLDRQALARRQDPYRARRRPSIARVLRVARWCSRPFRTTSSAATRTPTALDRAAGGWGWGRSLGRVVRVLELSAPFRWHLERMPSRWSGAGSGYTGIISGNADRCGVALRFVRQQTGPSSLPAWALPRTATARSPVTRSPTSVGPCSDRDAIEVRSAAANVTNNAITGATMGMSSSTGARVASCSQNTVRASTIGLPAPKLWAG